MKLIHARLTKSRFAFVVIAALSLTGSAPARTGQARLAPENATEARMNRLQPPDRVMDIIGVAAGMIIGEIGAGRGRFVVHLADRVGPTGKVYAEDIDAGALRHLEERCEREGLTNVESVLGDTTDPKLPAGRLDLIFIISSYHHFADPAALLRNARQALKPDGRVAIGEWIVEKGGRGEGVAPDVLTAQMESAGFTLERVDKTFEANDLYIYLFRPKASYRSS